MNAEKVGAREALRRVDAEEEERKEVKKPEYWGLTWEDLKPEGNWYVTKDGLRFPPIPWKNPEDGKTYWGLACCGGEPKGDGQEKIRYKMLYFKQDEAPDLTGFQFKDTAARKHGKHGLYKGIYKNPIKTDIKKYGDVKLKGTNATLAKTYAQIAEWSTKRMKTHNARRWGIRQDEEEEPEEAPKPKKPSRKALDAVKRTLKDEL